MAIVGLQRTRPHKRLTLPFGDVEIIDLGKFKYEVPSLSRIFDFSSAEKALGAALVEPIAIGCLQYFCRFSRKSALEYFYQLIGLFGHIATQTNLSKALKRAKVLTTGQGAELWREAVASQVKQLQAKTCAVTTYAEYLGCLFRVLDEMSSLGLTASCTKPQLPKNYHASGQHRPTLLEQSGAATGYESEIEQIENLLKTLNVDTEGTDVPQLVKALASNLQDITIRDSQSLAEAIFNLNRNTLEDLRSLAESKYLKWESHWQTCQNLLTQTTPNIANEIEHALSLPKHLKTKTLLPVFQSQSGFANMLKYFELKHQQRVPSENEFEFPVGIRKLYWEFGGRHFLDAGFCLHREGVAAAILLYLIDSGANVSVALNLTTNSEHQTDDSNYVEYVSYKDRAGPQPIIKSLELHREEFRITAAMALRGVKKMTQSIRNIYPELGDKLFVHRYFSTPGVANSEFLANQLEYLLRERNDSGKWTPSAIRTSVAVDITRKSGGDFNTLARSIQHTLDSTSTPIYGSRYPQRILFNQRIREYSELLEASYATHSMFGIKTINGNIRRIENNLEKAKKTGLGFLCKDSTSGIQPGTTFGQQCDKFGECPNCEMRLTVIDIESLSEFIAVNEILKKNEIEFMTKHPDEWASSWLNLYAFSSVVIEKVKHSRYAYQMPKAQKCANEMLAKGFNPLQMKR